MHSYQVVLFAAVAVAVVVVVVVVAAARGYAWMMCYSWSAFGRFTKEKFGS